MDSFNHIQDYISGQLPKAEKILFEKKILEDQILASAVEHAQSLQEIGDALIEEEVERIIHDHSQKVKSQSVYKKNWLFVVIMALLLTLIYYVYSNQKKTNDFPERYLAENYVEPAWNISRTENTDTISVLLSEYFSGNSSSTKNKMAALNTPESKYWLSELYLKELKGDSVLIHLPTLFKDNIRRDRIHYVEIMALYQQGLLEEVNTKISHLPADTDVFYIRLYSDLKL